MLDMCMELSRNSRAKQEVVRGTFPAITKRLSNKFECSCDEMHTITDEKNGDVVCTNCGTVKEERFIQYQQEFDDNDNLVQIQSSKSEFFDNTIMSTFISKNMGLMNVLQKQMSINQKELYRNKEFYEVERICTILNTTPNIANQAKHYFNNLCKVKTFRGVNRKAMMSCCILHSCNVNNIDRTVDELCESMTIKKTIFAKNLKIYEKMMNVKIINERTNYEVYRHLQQLGIPEKEVFALSNNIVKKQKEMMRQIDYQGKSPKILLAIILKHMEYDKRLICNVLKVSVTAF